MAVLFISEAKIKENSVVNGNVDNKRITPAIINVQRIYILPIIGTGLYNELATQITADTVTGLNQTLLDDYIQPTMNEYLRSELMYDLTFQYTNKGINTTNSQNAQPVNIGDINQLSDRNIQRAQVLAQRMSNYLCENTASYPLYENPGEGADIIHPDGDNYESNIAGI